jgi:membrane protease YdiL (CAAX protease family)
MEEASSLSPARLLARLPWRRYGFIALVLILFFLWLAVAEPLILLLADVPAQKQDLLKALPLAEGASVLVLAAIFTLRRSWRRHGFRGGIALAPWLAFWPIWSAALVLSVVNGASASLDDHLTTAAFAFSIGFSEEAVFRGVLFGALMARGAKSAIFWSSLWFAAFHLGNLSFMSWPVALLSVLATFVFGLTLGWVRWASASIWPSVLAHSFYDYACLLGGGLQASMTLSTSEMLGESAMIAIMLAWSLWLLSRKVRPGALTCREINPFAARRQAGAAAMLDEGGLAI